MLASDLLNSQEVRNVFLLADIDESDVSVIESLKTEIHSMGIKEFAELAEMSSTAVSRFVNREVSLCRSFNEC